MKRNIDDKTVAGFGDEWQRFNQSGLAESELGRLFQRYFHIFPWEQLPDDAVGFDLGCGSGRWASVVARRVGRLVCIDASAEALAVCRHNLLEHDNCDLVQASVDDMPMPDASMDFGYSLGVLHHVPDTAVAIKACVEKLKPGAPLLLYLYYAFDNRPVWYRMVWQVSDVVRRLVSRAPHPVRHMLSEVLAALVYWPLGRSCRLLERLGFRVDGLPLAAYRQASYYTMRTDALDRFGTSLEQRFSAMQIERMMQAAGLEYIEFSQTIPYWCAIGYRRSV